MCIYIYKIYKLYMPFQLKWELTLLCKKMDEAPRTRLNKNKIVLNYSKQNYPKKSLDRKNFRSEKPP